MLRWNYLCLYCTDSVSKLYVECEIYVVGKQLFWTKKPRGPAQSQSTSLTPLREFRQLVPGDQHVFRIPDLEPDTTYFVQASISFGADGFKTSSVNQSIYYGVVIRQMPTYTEAEIHLLNCRRMFVCLCRPVKYNKFCSSIERRGIKHMQ